ncbi:hypothetical protein HPB50_011384 [Hyalomma asiaticum]|uniref:Uncharacterized protein n=1 Tax=Hyalomma asiaticum TaxID=266040 RepID=A0ACB7T5U5_HYAAI|nr:hypothetical protein HPB50_011384 [Hyalomma asiaticum]
MPARVFRDALLPGPPVASGCHYDAKHSGEHDVGICAPIILGTRRRIPAIHEYSGAKRAFTLMLVGSSVVLIGIIALIAAKILRVKTSQTPKLATPPLPPLRKALLFCTVGYNFDEATDLKNKMPCDYLIYSDMIANNGTFVPLYGPRSWNAYKTALGSAPSTVIGGVSFSLSEGIGQNSTFDVIERQQAVVQSFVRQRMFALGTFDFEPMAGVQILALKKFFAEQLCRPSTGEVGNLSELLPTHIGTRLQTNREDRDAVPRSTMSLLKNHGRRIVPGEVRLVSRGLKKFDGHAHVSVVVQITAYNLLMLQRLRQLIEISTLIVETHITLREAHIGGHTDCHAYPISAVGIRNLANNSLPRLDVAEHAVSTSRTLGDMFRIVFSSSMGVMVYKQILDKPITRFRDACSTWNMGDYDVTCDDTLKKEQEETDLAAFAIANSGQYLFSFEDETSLKKKMERYLPSISDGWCLFDVHRDVYWTCGITIPPNAPPNQAIDITNSPAPMQRVVKVKQLIVDIKRQR